MVCIAGLYDVFFIDLDGVLWRGAEVLKDAVDAVNRLIELGKRVVFLTNNSTRHRKVYFELIKSAGVKEPFEVFTSAYATAILVRKLGVKRVCVIGEEGLVAELHEAGAVVSCELDSVDAVVVGLDRNVNYWKLASALKHLLTGSIFILTNPDTTLPTEQGILPGAYAIASALRVASGREPDYVVGKPNKLIFELAIEELCKGVDKSRILVIGDRIDTDVKGAENAGLDAALVLTGVANLRDYFKSSTKPKYVLSSLKEVFLGE